MSSQEALCLPSDSFCILVYAILEENSLLNRTDRGKERKGESSILEVFALDALCLIFIFLMERSMGSLRREEEKDVGRLNGNAFDRVLLTFWFPLTWLHSGKGYIWEQLCISSSGLSWSSLSHGMLYIIRKDFA